MSDKPTGIPEFLRVYGLAASRPVAPTPMKSLTTEELQNVLVEAQELLRERCGCVKTPGMSCNDCDPEGHAYPPVAARPVAPTSAPTRDSTVRCQKCGHTGVPSPTVVLDLEAEIRDLKTELADRAASPSPDTTMPCTSCKRLYDQAIALQADLRAAIEKARPYGLVEGVEGDPVAMRSLAHALNQAAPSDARPVLSEQEIALLRRAADRLADYVERAEGKLTRGELSTTGEATLEDADALDGLAARLAFDRAASPAQDGAK